MIPSTIERVPIHTDEELNARIQAQTQESIARYAILGPTAIDRRLDELEHEWDIERTLEANAASISLLGLALGATLDRRFFLLPTLVSGFLLQHAVQGWCPPIGFFRRRGVRTQAEIDQERYALKALRGDFEGIHGQTPANAERAIAAVEE